MRRRYVWVDGKGLVEIPQDWKPTPRKAPAVHGVKPEFKSMLDGKTYTDYGTYRRTLRAAGMEEVGNEYNAFMEPIEPPTVDWGNALRETAGEYGVNIDEL